MRSEEKLKLQLKLIVKRGPKSLKEIAKTASMKKSVVKRYLETLESAGELVVTPEGQWEFVK